MRRRLADLNWHLEIQATESQWAELASALCAWPSRVVIDHLGLPRPGDRGVVLDLARLAHVWVKVSAHYRSSAEQAEARARDLLDARLTDRLVFGSDWPFTQHENRDYASVVAWARRIVSAREFDERLTRNAAELFQIELAVPTDPAPTS